MAGLLIRHLTFYAVALWGWSSKSAAAGALKIPLYFVTVNLAILVAWIPLFPKGFAYMSLTALMEPPMIGLMEPEKHGRF